MFTASATKVEQINIKLTSGSRKAGLSLGTGTGTGPGQDVGPAWWGPWLGREAGDTRTAPAPGIGHLPGDGNRPRPGRGPAGGPSLVRPTDRQGRELKIGPAEAERGPWAGWGEGRWGPRGPGSSPPPT